MTARMLALIGAVGAALSTPAGGEMAVEWWGKAEYCRHKSMTRDADTERLSFNLSALPRGTKVYRASLRVHTRVPPARTDRRAYMNIGKGVFYYDPLRLYAELPPAKYVPYSERLGELLKGWALRLTCRPGPAE